MEKYLNYIVEHQKAPRNEIIKAQSKANIYLSNKCQLDCVYCNRKSYDDKKKAPELSLDVLSNYIQALSMKEYKRIRFTSRNGEPLFRKDLEILVKKAQTYNFEDIALTTNGVTLSERLENLKKAGLNRISISLDTLDRAKYKYLTGTDNIEKVLLSIEKAANIFEGNVRINTVVSKNLNDDEIDKIIDWAFQRNVTPQLIEYIGNSQNEMDKYFFNLDSVINRYSRFSTIITENRIEKRTTLTQGSGKNIEIRQSRKWSDKIYLSMKLAIHHSGYISNFMNDNSGSYPERFHLDNLISEMENVESINISDEDFERCRIYGNRHTVC